MKPSCACGLAKPSCRARACLLYPFLAACALVVYNGVGSGRDRENALVPACVRSGASHIVCHSESPSRPPASPHSCQMSECQPQRAIAALPESHCVSTALPPA
eukprot:11697710-Alexandrium_andersonii.AAC.1